MEAIFVNGVRSYALCHMGNYFNISLCSTRRFNGTNQTKDKSLLYLYLQTLRLPLTIVNVRLIYTRPMEKRQVDYSKPKTRNKTTQGNGPTYTIITYYVIIISSIGMVKRKARFLRITSPFYDPGTMLCSVLDLGHIFHLIYSVPIYMCSKWNTPCC